MNYPEILQEIAAEVGPMPDPGAVANYIPELAGVAPDRFGMYLAGIDGAGHGTGDCEQRFSIQSVAKVLSLALAFELEEERLWERVGVEPSGTAFNSLVQLETENGIPRNPFINAGALVICDVLASRLRDPRGAILEFVRNLSGTPDVDFSATVAASEKRTGFRNRAHINLMKAYGNINNDTEQVLELYFDLCSIEMSCAELARTFLFLAAQGENPLTGERVLSTSRAKRINAIMLLCGFYDEAGEFAFRVGLPGKSGVGGGIVAVHPGEYSIAVWSPRLNHKGNSVKGMKALELLTTRTGSSIF